MDITKWAIFFFLVEIKLGLSQMSSGLRKVARTGLARGRNEGKRELKAEEIFISRCLQECKASVSFPFSFLEFIDPKESGL